MKSVCSTLHIFKDVTDSIVRRFCPAMNETQKPLTPAAAWRSRLQLRPIPPGSGGNVLRSRSQAPEADVAGHLKGPHFLSRAAWGTGRLFPLRALVQDGVCGVWGELNRFGGLFGPLTCCDGPGCV